MIWRTVPAWTTRFFAGETHARRVASGVVPPPHLFTVPARRAHMHARALRAALFLSLYTGEEVKKVGQWGGALFCAVFKRLAFLESGGAGGSAACGAVANGVILPLIAGALPVRHR